MLEPLVEVSELEVGLPSRSGVLGRASLLRIIRGADLTIGKGEIVGLVGESGSGKTTLGRAILRLLQPTGGSISFDGQDISHLDRSALRPLRRRMQMIFQDPYSSLDPRQKVGDIISEAYAIHKIGSASDRRQRVVNMLSKVGLPADAANRYPHEFSGGQRQRIGIARALAVEPEFIVADEPVSALDVSVQAQVLNLLLDLQQSLGLTMLLIAHDLSVVQFVSDRIAVLYLGRVMEIARSAELYARPLHPYTVALLEAAPVPDPKKRTRHSQIKGEIPSVFNPPSGCVFRTRCPYALPACAESVPRLVEVSPGHSKACIRDDILSP